MLKAVLLDVDNTLLSFDEAVRGAMREGFVRFGLPPYEERMFPVFEQLNNGLWQALERREIDLDHIRRVRWQRVFDALGIEGDGPAFEAFFRDWLHESAVPVDGAMDLLRALQGRYVLCAASNGPFLQQRRRLERGGMLPFFTHLFVSEEIGFSKPSGAFFGECLRRLGQLAPAEAVMVGDSLTSDIAGGLAAGMRTVWFDPRGETAPASCRPDAAVRTLGEIPACLRALDA